MFRGATLTRNLKISGPEGLFGGWVSSTGFRCVTAERPKNVVIHPAIPTCIVLCELEVSPRLFNLGVDYGFGRGVVYRLHNVPGRDHILIHSANWPTFIKTEHEPEHYQLEGCIAPGAAVTKIQVPDPDGRLVLGVTSSKTAVKALMADMKGDPFQLTIKEI
jgi:hypothetical protein